MNEVSSRFDMSQMPIKAFEAKTKRHLGKLLDPIKILPAENGNKRDWRGLFSVIGLETHRFYDLLKELNNPTEELLEIWTDCGNVSIPANAEELYRCLEEIDRWDVIDDLSDAIINDTRRYFEIRNRPSAAPTAASNARSTVPACKIITQQDNDCAQKGLPLPYYDALLLFVEQDKDFADQIVKNLNNQYNICVPSSDFMPGLITEVGAAINIIAERCHCVIAIITPDFNASNLCQYLIEYCLSAALENNRKKIIPCLPEICPLPRTITFMSSLKYFHKEFDFFVKLRSTLMTAIQTESRIEAPVLNEPADVTNDGSEPQSFVRQHEHPIFPPPAHLRMQAMVPVAETPSSTLSASCPALDKTARKGFMVKIWDKISGKSKNRLASVSGV